MTRATLVVELQTEELPPKALRALANAFAGGVVDGLFRAGLAETASPSFRVFATPRRLGVSVADVRHRADDREVVDKLMPTSVGLDEAGRPTAALIKRLEKVGRAAVVAAPDWTDGPDRLYTLGEGKAAALHLRTVAKGRLLVEALQDILDDAIARLPIPKRMSYQRYADGVETTVQFVRPAHGLLALFGADIVPIRALGLEAGRTSIGHRFVGMKRVAIRSADDYEETLRRDGRVLAGFDVRRAAIEKGLAAVARDDRVVSTDALLDEVTALVEWPAVYRGTFDPAFLDVPQECLILTMQQNQKYFALTDANGRLVDRFLVVSNIERDDPTEIVGGNERVLRARLADAKFFFDQDRKRTLASRVEQLKTIVYHNRLGSQHDRMVRVKALAGRIAGLIGADETRAMRAAELAKTDLVTDMVGEFPELQGLMGRYYALHDGEDADVAQAIEEQYRPRFAGDALPVTTTGICVALADKLETLVGLFGIGAVPTGDKDPFALRRHALGVIRILVEKHLRVGLLSVVDLAIAEMPDQARSDWLPIVEFLLDRSRSYFVERGFDVRAVNAVLVPLGYATPLYEISRIIPAASEFLKTSQGRELAEANKRIVNILKKSHESHQVPFGMSPKDLEFFPSEDLFEHEAERSLWRALRTVGMQSLELREKQQFAESLLALSGLAAPTTAFFSDVLVNADDAAVRDNRITLLQHARAYMNQVADLSMMVGQ